MHCYVLLPSYNERRSLAKLLPEAADVLHSQGMDFTLLVVDDGSSDGTAGWAAALAPQMPVRILSHERNKGYGAALRTGFSWVAQNAAPGDTVISMDADTTHSPAYIPALLARLAQGFDVVTASYTRDGAHASGVPALRRLMSFGANSLFRCAFPASGLSTYTNGFRAYRAGFLQNLAQRHGASLIVENGFAGGTELFLKALAGGARAAEIPFDLHYERRGAESKIRLGRTIRGYLSLLWRLKRTRSNIVQ